MNYNTTKVFLLVVAGLAGLFAPQRGLAAEAWRAEWDETVKAAEAEGHVTLYFSGYSKVLDSGAFQKAFPKIKVVTVGGSGSVLSQRIAAERRGEKYLADVYNGGGNSLYQALYLAKFLDPIKPALILPEVTDTSKWWENTHKYTDGDSRYIFVYEGNVSSGGNAAYNTQQLNPAEYRSYWDLLNPKLKSKITSVDPRRVRGAGASWQFLYYHKELGVKFVQRLFSEMEVVLAGEIRQAVDWVASGKVAVCVPCQGSSVVRAKNQGLPISDFPILHFKEGINISSAFGQLALMNRAPHPNAAKVFINWYLSREGQIAFQKEMSQPGDPKNSRRLDVPKDHVPAQEQRTENLKYFDSDAQDSKDLRPLEKLLTQILGEKS
ncbi:MAG TPA: extracellular solute-binding protein [Candidatus Binatia bacterium]|nr:extracellular solute-binding protein [Candidatus Binatia bacterium]